jgi:uncharacterized protein (TIGR02284 family)
MSQTEMVQHLNALLTALEDAKLNFTEAATKIESKQLGVMLGEYADDCTRALHDLQKLVQTLGQPAATGASAGGTLRKGWIKLKAALAADAEAAGLEEAADEHARVEAAFEQLLKDELPPEFRETVERERQHVLRWSDSVRRMHKVR